jgi:hypothetical protein
VVLVKGQLRDRGGRAGQGGPGGQPPAGGGAGGAGGQGGGDVELTVEEIIPLDRWRERAPAGIDLVVAPDMPAPDLRRLRDLLYEHPGPVPVSISMRDAERTVRITTDDKCKVDFGSDLAAAIEAILGPGCVRKRPEQAV